MRIGWRRPTRKWIGNVRKQRMRITVFRSWKRSSNRRGRSRQRFKRSSIDAVDNSLTRRP
jgi:hypothetical protein